ncbi:AsmA family protein [Marinomonas piezotolerans]|uniref:AsmA family protein n=1 Tax=Marinomonas piezotolerans TaxID=2213058 RepID=A0A370U6H9_9GAMM|nr:AsmA family protein [Marinomonas piezotolerans]RDL43363.1 AsmA family protein [Marinomonas piezotolerans]
MVWLKRLGILLAAIVVAATLAVVYVIAFVDPNQFKGELQKVAKEKANVTLRMDGDISWSFYPRLGLSLENIGVALGNDPELLSFSKAEFGVAVMPLFERRIEVDTVRLVDLKADLNVDEQGKANWLVEAPTAETNNLKSSESNTQAATNSDAVENDSDAGFTIPDIALDELSIVNAQINYADARADMKANIVSDVTFNDVKLDQSWPMRMKATLSQSTLDGSNPIKANVEFGANFTLFAERQAVSFENVTLKSDVEGDFLPVSPLLSTLTISQFDFDLPQENAALDGFALQTMGLNVTGQVQAYQILTAPEFSVVADIAEFSPKELLGKLNVSLPEMADESVMASASLNLAAKGSLDSVKIQPISVKFDDTTLEANALLNLTPLSWDVTVAGANLDVDRYLPPVVEDSVAESASAEQTKAEEAVGDLIPVELVRGLNGHYGLAFDTLKVKNLNIDRIELDSTQSNGKVTISPAKMSLYDGAAEVNAELDVTDATPQITVSPSINGVQIQPLLQDFMKLDKIAGATYLNGDLVTTGNQVDAFMKNLNGDLLVSIDDGALVGMNLTKTVCEGIAASRSRTLDASAYGNDTPFETMTFPAKIVNGEVSTPGLTLSAAGLSVTGDGTVSLPNSSLNYRTNVAVTGSQLDGSCAVKDYVSELAFPIVCKGKFSDDPAGLCRPDLGGFADIFAGLAKAELDAKLAAEKARADAKLAAEKARIQAQLDAKKAELEAKKKAEEDAAKEALEEKLKSKLKDLF